jgi:hypothetical protein
MRSVLPLKCRDSVWAFFWLSFTGDVYPVSIRGVYEAFQA